MNHQASQGEIENLTAHLMAALDDVVINRYTYGADGLKTGIEKKLKIPIIYGHKTRQLGEAINIKGHIRLPAISVSLNGISLDQDKNTNKNRDLLNTKWDGVDGYASYKYPTPVKLSYNVKIVTKDHPDFDQIVSHYISVFNPYIQVSWKHPFAKEKLISKVLWDGNVGMEFPENLAADQKARFIGNLNFTVEGHIFRDNVGTVGTIDCLDVNIRPLTLDGTLGEEITESFTLKAKPEFLEVIPECVKAGKYITLYGNNLSDIEGIYALPLNGDTFPTSSFNPFCFSENLSASCPEFEGYQFPTYDVLDTNTIAVKIPESLSGKNIDLMVTNRHAGCIKLSEANLSGDDCHQKFVEVI